MNKAERTIMATFRRYSVGPNEMLFFNNPGSSSSTQAFRDMIEKGWIGQDRRPHSYFLTSEGYEAMLAM